MSGIRLLKTRDFQLVTRADDAGGCESANAAILEGVEAGTVKNVSLMACGSAVDAAARLLKGKDNVCLGLHVTLNAEWDAVKWGPVLPPERVPSLLEPGTSYFTPTPRALKDKGFLVSEAVAEVEAHLARLRALGLTITYLDEHMGVGWITDRDGRSLRDALGDLCRREGLLQAHTIPVSGLPLASMPPGEGAEDLVDHWLTRLNAAEPGTYLLVTHPGRNAPDMANFVHAGLTPGQVAKERDRERRALTLPRFSDELARRGIPLLRYDEVEGVSA